MPCQYWSFYLPEKKTVSNQPLEKMNLSLSFSFYPLFLSLFTLLCKDKQRQLTQLKLNFLRICMYKYFPTRGTFKLMVIVSYMDISILFENFIKEMYLSLNFYLFKYCKFWKPYKCMQIWKPYKFKFQRILQRKPYKSH